MVKFNVLTLITLLVGALLGALFVSLTCCNAEIPTSGLISAASVLIVGYWINNAVRRRGVLDRVPIDYMLNLHRRIDELISTCFNAAIEDNSLERLTDIARLSNEINWLDDIVKRVQPGEELGDSLTLNFILFKMCLTEGETVDMVLASKASNDMRIIVLRVQWHICRHVLDQDTNTDILAPS